MKFFKMFGTVTSPVPVKKCPLIPLWEVYLLSKFNKRSSLTSRNMADKQNHMIMSIFCHQHLWRIVLRLFTKRCIYCSSFTTVPHLEKEMYLIGKFTGLCSCNVIIICENMCSYGSFLFRGCTFAHIWWLKPLKN